MMLKGVLFTRIFVYLVIAWVMNKYIINPIFPKILRHILG